MMKYLFLFFLAISLLGIQCCTDDPQGETNRPEWVLVIHGGAGTILKENMTPERERQYLEKLEEALEAGAAILNAQGSSLDAVTAAVMVMEDSPLFNAARGSVFNAEGSHEMDAAVMDGRDLNAGAVTGLKHVRNPILAARLVMDSTSHVMLSGEGAEQLARDHGLPMEDSAYFFTQPRYDSYLKAKSTEEKFGTVGAAALDKYGNLAAATSTGGRTFKMMGRVGDSPVIGAGTYADNQTCAVSATGHGEFFIRHVVAYDIAARMKYEGRALQQAADEVIFQKLKTLGGMGGVIAVDKDGNIAMPFNTAGMYRGYYTSDGQKDVLIYGD